MEKPLIEYHGIRAHSGDTSIATVVIVKLSAIGDVIHALPILRKLKTRNPSPRIAWIVESKAADLLRGNPLLDELIVVDTYRWRRSLAKVGLLIPLFSLLLRFVVHVRRLNAVEVYDLQGLFKSSVIAYLTGSKQRIGFSRKLCKEPISSMLTSVHRGSAVATHVVDLNLSLLGETSGPVQASDFVVTVEAVDQEAIDRFFVEHYSGQNFIVAINPGAGWSTKTWPAEYYAKLCRKLAAEPGVQVLLLWGPGEEALAARIAKEAGGNPVLAPPTTLKQLYYLLSKCELFIGGDTGPLHLAAAAGVPCLALFAPTDPKRNGPYGDRHTVIWKRLQCHSCYKRTCVKQAECIESIPLGFVTEQAIEMIASIRENRVQARWLELA